MTARKMWDLSVALDETTQVYPGDPKVRISPATSIATDGFALHHVNIGSQSGTHVDAPTHFWEDGLTIDQLPLERFVGRAVIVDVRGIAARGRIGLSDLASTLDAVTPGDIVLFHTNWSRHWGTPQYFENPFVDIDACQALLDRGVRTFGIDALNIDETPDETHAGEGFPVHHAIARAEGVIIENMTNLDAILNESVTVSVLPLAFRGLDGAPVRAVAWSN